MKKKTAVGISLVLAVVVLLVGFWPGQVDAAGSWVRRYNGSGGTFDVAKAIAVDSWGNVYVTGYSTGATTDKDYATIKYDKDGNKLWVMRYNGPGNGADEANAIFVDTNGNVYVTGYSTGSTTNKDYATIKYDEDGYILWVKRYNGPGNGADEARAIVVDNFGVVYVTGYSTGSTTDKDYATITYGSDGSKGWVKRYNGPGNGADEAYAIALQSENIFYYVYVTGGSTGSGTALDYATIKYNTAGLKQWERRYDGPANSYDVACALVAVQDADVHDVYITGYSRADGKESDYATIRYRNDGFQYWVRRHDGPSHMYDVAYAIALDALRNVYVTGSSCQVGETRDYATIKYSSEGTRLWRRWYNGPAGGGDEARAIAVDSSSNVYVTGVSAGAVYSDYATIKYSTAGARQWVKRYNGPGNEGDCANAIAVDGSGNNVYVTGSSVGLGISKGEDYATIKYALAP